MVDATTWIDKENQTHRHEVSTRSRTAKRWRTQDSQDSQDINRKQPIRPTWKQQKSRNTVKQLDYIPTLATDQST
eukprot:1148938-Amphidinium_carterae.1